MKLLYPMTLTMAIELHDQPCVMLYPPHKLISLLHLIIPADPVDLIIDRCRQSLTQGPFRHLHVSLPTAPGVKIARTSSLAEYPFHPRLRRYLQTVPPLLYRTIPASPHEFLIAEVRLMLPLSERSSCPILKLKRTRESSGESNSSRRRIGLRANGQKTAAILRNLNAAISLPATQSTTPCVLTGCTYAAIPRKRLLPRRPIAALGNENLSHLQARATALHQATRPVSPYLVNPVVRLPHLLQSLIRFHPSHRKFHLKPGSPHHPERNLRTGSLRRSRIGRA